jgi:large subunit ribosomal protein L34e
MVQRITYRRRLSYNTLSNRRKVTRTPGGRLVFQYLKKRPAVPRCPMTGIRLKGITPSRPSERKRLSLRHKKVFRAYGGTKAGKMANLNISVPTCAALNIAGPV